jgi:tRNA A-37 threonylcarbamoyl transferase component Bud32
MQTNSELWLDRTLRIGACGTWWAAGTPGGQTLGTLQLDPDLMAVPAVRDRVAAAIAAIREANPPGVLRTTELVYDSRRAWLVVANLPQPTLADLLAAGRALPSGAAAGIAVDVADALRGLHAAGLHHGDLDPATVVLTGAGAARLAEVGVLAAVRDAPIDIGADAAAWGGLARALAAGSPEVEASLLIDAAGTAESGDLTAAARRLALGAEALPDFETRDDLAALLATIDPAASAPEALPAPSVPAQRSPSTMDRVAVRRRFGPGVPDSALLHPRPLDDEATRRPRRLLRVLGIAAASVLVVLAGSASAWWFLLR